MAYHRQHFTKYGGIHVRISGKGRRRPQLSPGTALRLGSYAARFLLAAVLAGAEILGGHALFGLALVAVSGSGGEGAAALLGAAMGYLSLRGPVEGLRYIAASMMIYAVSLAFSEYRVLQSRWFMPAAACAISGAVGFVYQSAAGWDTAARVAFLTETVLTAGVVYLFRQGLEVWSTRRTGDNLTPQQAAGLFAMAAAAFLSLARVDVGGCSVGRTAAYAAVALCAWKWGAGVGAAAGVSLGIAMDLAVGALGRYTPVFALPGLLAGLFPRQRRIWCASAFAASASAAAVWTANLLLPASTIREVLAGTVLFLILPERFLERLESLTRQETSDEEERQVRRFAARRLGDTAKAYQEAARQLEGAFPVSKGEKDAVRIWERAADRVCTRCRLKERCWQREYQATRSALTDALAPMEERGVGKPDDFPPRFVQQCVRFETFLDAVNGELAALRQRRAFQSRIQESRSAVCAHYGELARVLEKTSAELAAEPALDIRRQRLVKQRLTALGIRGSCTVYQDGYGHLQVEAAGAGADKLSEPGQVGVLEELLQCPLDVAESGRGKVKLSQREALSLLAGAAGADRAGSPVSGDTGAWFKLDSGLVNFLLCDGMGSGSAARGDSAAAVKLLERFLRAGSEPEEALRTVGAALALRGEGQGGFTTVDLCQVDLYSGTCRVYKLGAAPTYIRRGGEVSTFEGSTLPAGLADGTPDCFSVQLRPGDCILLVSDGVTGTAGDRWLMSMLADFDGVSPRELAGRLLTESSRRTGAADDRTVIVIKLESREERAG